MSAKSKQPKTEDLRNPKDIVGSKKVNTFFVPPVATLYMALAMQEGARKYGPYNWREKKIQFSEYDGAAQRHRAALLDGQWLDPESGLPHLAHYMATLAIIADAFEAGALIDDRPTQSGGSPAVLEQWRKKA